MNKIKIIFLDGSEFETQFSSLIYGKITLVINRSQQTNGDYSKKPINEQYAGEINVPYTSIKYYSINW
jgi:hypothetical protein